jgi:hypothetical protein
MSMTLALAHVSAPPEEQSGEKKPSPTDRGHALPIEDLASEDLASLNPNTRI